MITLCLSREHVQISNRAAIGRVLARGDVLAEGLPAASPTLLSDLRLLAGGLLSVMNSQKDSPVALQGKQGRRVIGKHVIVSMGNLGVLWVGPTHVIGNDADVNLTDAISSRYIPSSRIPREALVNTSGAGDTFCAGLINSLLPGQGTGPTLQSIIAAMKCAEQSLMSQTAVPNEFEQPLISKR